MALHSLDPEIAIEYGMPAAVLLQNIAFWVEHNETKGINFHDGKYWTFASVKNFTDMFPYMSKNTITRSLDKMEETGLIECGNYNKSPYDRTKWYTTKYRTVSGLKKINCSNSEDGGIDLPKIRNEKTQSQKPIPDINTDINTNINTDINNTADKSAESDQLEKDFAIIYKSYPIKKGKGDAFRHYKNWLKGKQTPFGRTKLTNKQIWDAIQAYKRTFKDGDYTYMCHFSTFMNSKILDYVENEE